MGCSWWGRVTEERRPELVVVRVLALKTAQRDATHTTVYSVLYL
jgi:hypothetical protein